jgi:hypothetical protein
LNPISHFDIPQFQCFSGNNSPEPSSGHDQAYQEGRKRQAREALSPISALRPCDQRWAKKIRGRLNHFGQWDDPEGSSLASQRAHGTGQTPQKRRFERSSKRLAAKNRLRRNSAVHRCSYRPGY